MTTRFETVDLAGWETRMGHLAAGLDLADQSGRAFLASKLAGVAELPTLRALASWMGVTTRSANPARVAQQVADAWQRELCRRAAADTPGFDVWSRLPAAPSDEAW